MLYGSKRSGSTIRVLRSSLMKALRNQLKVGCLSQDTSFWAGDRPGRKTQCHACSEDADGQRRLHESLLAATVRQRNGAAGTGWSLCFITCPRTRYIWFCHRLGFRCQRWMNIITWVYGQPTWQGNLIPFFRFAESFHHVLRWENCHCLPKTPWSCFLLLGRVLQFTFYCLRWARARAVKVWLFH